jgi:hypothetical protein
VADADFAAELIEKAWTAGRGWLSGGGDWKLETGAVRGSLVRGSWFRVGELVVSIASGCDLIL